MTDSALKVLEQTLLLGHVPGPTGACRWRVKADRSFARHAASEKQSQTRTRQRTPQHYECEQCNKDNRQRPAAVTKSQQRDNPGECPGLLDLRILTSGESVHADCPNERVSKPNQARLLAPRTNNQPVDVHDAECNHYGAHRPGAAVTKLWDTWSASRLSETTLSHCM